MLLDSVPLALTFDDVLMKPGASSVLPATMLNVSACFTVTALSGSYAGTGAPTGVLTAEFSATVRTCAGTTGASFTSTIVTVKGWVSFSPPLSTTMITSV